MTILNILSKVPIFRNIKDEDLRKIEGILKEKQFTEKDLNELIEKIKNS